MPRTPAISSQSAPTAAAARQGRLRRACRDLETVFLTHLVKSMGSTADQSGLFGKAPGSDLYDSMMHDALASAVADAGGAGLADLLYRQLQNAEVEGENI
jgi:flagellar protein FlgJ